MKNTTKHSTQGDRWMVRLGAFRIGANNIGSPDEEVRAISNVFIHPGYISTSLINDISILRMEEPVRFTDFIRPICLPPPTDDIRNGRLCTVIGWGRLDEIELKYRKCISIIYNFVRLELKSSFFIISSQHPAGSSNSTNFNRRVPKTNSIFS